ncbi:MAG: hypothetical protein K5924_07405 [Chloroflexi bacterium]|nr:hypothetical protein [Chloroflexota bacterium]
MMLPPNPGVLDSLVRDRQNRITPTRVAVEPARAVWRVRLGHVLIAAGSRLSGERAEAHRHSTLPHHA